jgi:hypothetical protein
LALRDLEAMYLVDCAAQEHCLAQLVSADAGAPDGTRRLRDPQTGEAWVLYHALGRPPGRGPRLLRQEGSDLPLPDRLAACFASGRRDDLVGLAWDLSETPDSWQPMIEWLEQQEGLAPEQIELFLGNITILGAINRRPVAGRQVGDVLSEFRRFSSLAERARQLVRPHATAQRAPSSDRSEADRP